MANDSLIFKINVGHFVKQEQEGARIEIQYRERTSKETELDSFRNAEDEISPTRHMSSKIETKFCQEKFGTEVEPKAHIQRFLPQSKSKLVRVAFK